MAMRATAPEKLSIAWAYRIGLITDPPNYLAASDSAQRLRVALINSPALLLCDEPTGSLDGARAEEIADLLFELHKRENNILICATHSTALAHRFERRFDLRGGTCVEV